MNPKLGKAIKYTLSFAIAGVLLWLAFRSVNWNDFLEGLRQTDWKWVVASMALGLTAFILRGLRWNQILHPLDSSIRNWETSAGVCVCNLANCVIPASGEFVRSGLLATGKAGYDKVFGTVLLERTWDVIILGAIYLLIFIFDWGGAGTFFAGSVWKPMISSLGFWVWLLIAAITALSVLGVWAVFRYREKSRLCARLHRILTGIFKGFAAFRYIHGKVLFLFYSVGIWVCYWFMCVCIIHAFPPAGGLGVMDALMIMAAGSLASLLPAPGGFGTYHYAVTLTLSGLLGFSWETGLVFATIAHESQALNMVISGAVGYVLLAMRKRGNEPDPSQGSGAKEEETPIKEI